MCLTVCTRNGGMVQEANAWGNSQDMQTWTTAAGV